MATAQASYRICVCPSCDTRFRVTDVQLAMADGQVRCGACLALFDGRTTLVEAAQTAVTPAGRPALAQADALLLDAAAKQSRSRFGLRLLGVAALGLALALQVLWLQADAWALQPSLRPGYQTLCRLFGCQLPPALAGFDVAQPVEVVRGQPPATLTLSGRIVNRAPFGQPLPTLLVLLRDAANSPVAAHRVPPADYLVQPGVALLGPGETGEFSVRIGDPDVAAADVQLVLLPADEAPA